jgi:alkanesulfonate monooxygenase SsuD/methylene tetrahydromethanopterin reductase-like flavin-dependent oxidoreductase (luciferase family)
MMIIAQKPWPTIEEDVANYRELYREINGEEAPKPLLASWVAVHESQAAAEEMRDRWIMGYCDSVLKHYEFANAGLAEIPGYEYYGKLAERIAKHGAEDFSRFLAGLQVSGTPASVTEQLRENIRRIDGAGVVGIFNYAGMPDDVAGANLELFADKVLPTLQAIDTGAHVGLPVTAAAR